MPKLPGYRPTSLQKTQRTDDGQLLVVWQLPDGQRRQMLMPPGQASPQSLDAVRLHFDAQYVKKGLPLDTRPRPGTNRPGTGPTNHQPTTNRKADS